MIAVEDAHFNQTQPPPFFAVYVEVTNNRQCGEKTQTQAKTANYYPTGEVAKSIIIEKLFYYYLRTH